MSKLLKWLPIFQSKKYYNPDQKRKLDIAYLKEFLWPEEKKLIY